MRKYPSWLQRNVLDALDTSGGHIAICLGLLVVYGQASGTGLAHDIALFAMGVLSRSMGTSDSAAKVSNVQVNRAPDTGGNTQVNQPPDDPTSQV